MVEIHERVAKVPVLVGHYEIAVLASTEELLQTFTHDCVAQIEHKIGHVFRLFPRPIQHLIKMTGTTEIGEWFMQHHGIVSYQLVIFGVVLGVCVFLGLPNYNHGARSI